MKKDTEKGKMKLFIWDDRNYRLIEEGDKYDEKNFCIVRKLFVRYKVPTAVDPAEEICKAFNRFGEVEDVEIVKQILSLPAGLETKSTIAYEAYVQFKRSMDAYATLKSETFPKNLLHLLPANTWHQPEFKDDDKKESAIVQCNHRCQKTDTVSEVSCSLEELSLRGSEILCEHALIEFELELTPGTTLNEIRRTLNHVKPHVGHLTITLCDGFASDEEEDCVNRSDFHCRSLEVIGKHAAGPKLQELTIGGFAFLSKGMLETLAPALKPLETLTMRTRHCNLLYLMQSFCPKLETFRLLGREWDGDGDEEVIQSWPTLKILVLRGPALDTESDTVNGKRLRRFFSLNPQLEALEADFWVDNSLLKAIVKGMRGLRTLTIERDTFEGIGGIFNHVVRLKRLESIMVTTWLFKTCHFKSLLACVECFSNMKRLQLTTLVQNYVLPSGGVVNAEDFPVTYHHDCECHGRDNRTVTFGDRTDAIQLSKDKRSLVVVVFVARDLKTADKTLEARIMTMFKGAQKFYPKVHKTTIIPEDDRFVFLHVASTI